jgi:exosortase/archaeosortase family protein
MRIGFILRLPSGDLGVADACSGIRSLTALLAAGLVLAHLRGLSWLRTILLVLLTFPIVVACNGVRIIVAGLLQQYAGVADSEGWEHQALGITVVLGSLAAVAGLARLLSRPRPTPEPEPPPPHRTSGWVWAPALVLSLAMVGSLWAETMRREFREDVDLARLPSRIQSWQGEDVAIPHAVWEMLTFDKGLYRVYRNPIGQEVHTWVLFWTTPAHTLGTAETHHPDICWPTRGWSVRQRDRRMVRAEGRSSQIAASVRHYEQKGRSQVVIYWTQEGPRGPQRPEDQPLADRTGHGWIAEVLAGRYVRSEPWQMTVLVGADVWSSPMHTEQDLARFCAALLAEIYGTCPWAEPPSVSAVKPDPARGSSTALAAKARPFLQGLEENF